MLNLSAVIVIRTSLAAALSLTALAMPQAPANAYSLRVKMACATDYYAFCSQHGLESQGLRQCMNVNGPKLTTPCIKALVADGEVSQSEVSHRAAAAGRAL